MDTATGSLAIEAFLAAANAPAYPAFRAGEQLTAEAEAFLRGYYADIASDTTDAPSDDDLLALAHDFFSWASAQPAGEQAVQLRPARGAGWRALGRDVLEIVGPDMPFLVDSVMGELADRAIAALTLAHPIASDAAGRARSFIQVHLRHVARPEALIGGVRDTLADVRCVVSDFGVLKARMRAAAAELAACAAAIDRADLEEGVALLEWLIDDRFTFLGARDYEYARDANGDMMAVEPVILAASGLGLLRDPERFVLRATSEPLLLTPEWRRLLNEPTPLVVAKSTLRARVHRRTSADYVGVKRYDKAGQVIGETRFIGLFTTEAFTDSTRDIPGLRQKAAWVVANAGFRPGGHSEKSLRHVIETYPRDDLWQITREELLETARAIVRLMDRPRPRVFTRRDRFDRFISALAFLPRDRYNSRVRAAVGRMLEAQFGGRIDRFEPLLGEGPLARVHFLIADIDKARGDPAPGVLDAQAAALSQTWEDGFADALNAAPDFTENAREQVRSLFGGAFSAAYRERYDAAEALRDVAEILRAGEETRVHVRASRREGDGADVLRCKIYARGEVLALSATVPIFENLGLYVSSEQNYEVRPAHGAPVHVHDLDLRAADGSPIDLAAVDDVFEEAFTAIWKGEAENDGFNRIVLRLGVRWREAALLRALARYRQLSGLDPSQAVQEAALAAHPDIAALMLALFRVRFDPALPEDMQARRDWAQGVRDKIEAALAHVVSLDEDRVLRRMTDLIGAIVRTNYYQPDTAGEAKPYISFKIASRELADLPAPKPFREIWVSSPQVEGVHLRFGPVARGGLRWSDRRDDFRTEVLDLVKAQQVKNAIIVPVGAKGGFFPKRLPARAAPGYLPAGVEAYRTYLRGLLDLTDNIVSGATAAPAHVVRWDGDDPYLVVAADKGTATFSDIANAMAAEYGFWLGDAFASGGSVGYDHKAMGITARGAWEAVKRHFREIGKNIQEEPFDVIGVGDMSGDVFGNGMLLSRKIRLLAAFDHRHIFIDPAPRDLDAAWAERKRLFDLQRSSWDDYDKNLISEGGGVFARTLKAIPITAEIAELTGFRTQSATPAELIGALLRSPCELLWFGGIGAFIKARAESNADVGDRANDFTRVDAEDVRALVIGEGANLGVTQRGRIAFARKGGRINSDAIDNSAGVDTSDHEVNIKILLADAIESGALGEEARPELLASMTEEVAALVLRDNYDQTLALTLAEANAPADLDSHERFMERLEKAEKLSRTVEGLPSAEEVRALRAAGLGLTRPELAKIIAYSKLDLSEVLAQSSAPDDPAFEAPLVAYFPPQLKRFEAQMKRHRLRRELIATYLADDLVNFGGATFVDRVRDATRADAVTIACAYEAGRRIFALNDLITRIHALDNESPASAQTMLYLEIAAATRRIVMYLAPRMRAGGVGAMIEAYEEAVTAQRAQGAALLTAVETARFEERRRHFIEAGAPADLARETALIAPQSAGLHAADLARKHDMPVLAAAFLHRAVGAAFGLDRLRAEAVALKVEAHWDRLAIRRAVDALFAGQDALADAAAAAIAHPGVDAESAADAVSAWRAGLGAKIAPALETIAQLDVDGGWSFAKLMLASAEVSGLVSTIGR